MTRAWFRRRLDADPRRWVLLLAALEGLGGYALKAADNPVLTGSGTGFAFLLVALALAPGLGVLAMLAHGRLVWWTGALLGGRARPHELHAAFAWSELPFVVAVTPLVLAIGLRAGAALMHPVPAVVQFLSDLLRSTTTFVVAVAAVAVIAGAVQYVRFVGEAQGFRARRTLANLALAAVAGLAILAGAIAAGAWMLPDALPLVRVSVGLAVVTGLATSAELAARGAARRATRAGTASP